MNAFTNTLRQSFIQMSSPAKLMLLLILVLFFMILGSAIAVLLAIPLYDLDLASLYRLIENPDENNIGIIKFFQIVQSVFLFIIPALLAAWLFSKNSFDYLQAGKGASVITLAMVLSSLFLAVPLMNAVTMLNSKLDLPDWMNGLENTVKSMEENAARLTELFLESNSMSDLAVNFLMIAILPALGEEFLFRGVIQRLFSDWTRNKHMGVILAAFLFSFIHFQFYGFIPRFLLGLYFGYLLVWSSSIWVPVAGHLINNGMAVIYYHFSKKPVGDTIMDKIGTGQDGHYPLYLSVFFTAILIGIIYLHEKKSRISG
jgi:membrane protease YdiL (CAAX protease family)